MISNRVLFLVAMLLAQCVATSPFDSERFFAEEAAKQAAASESRKAEIASKVEASRVAGNPLMVSSVSVVRNSAGGQEPGVSFYNTSGKTIKYVTFNTAFYNPVGDKPKCNITGVSTARLKSVGPFEHGSYRPEFWKSSIYYDGTCCIEIGSVEIDFIDGTSQRLDKAAVDRCGSPEGWNTWEGIGRANAAQAARFGF